MPFGLSKKEFLARAFNRSGATSLLRHVPNWRGLLVLNYHRIGRPETSKFDYNLWSATEENFAEQVRFLSTNFDVIGLADLDDIFARKSGKHVLITFDDGYIDNYELAFPILQAYGTPATFFITTGFLDNRTIAWWDEIAWMIRSSQKPGLPSNNYVSEPTPLNLEGDPKRTAAVDRFVKVYWTLSAEQTETFLNDVAELTGSGRCPKNANHDPWMTWDMVRDMHKNGMSIAAHTASHPILSHLKSDQQSYEIRESKRRVEQEVACNVDALSYPVGGRKMFNGATKMAMQRAGLRYGFSYYGEYCRFGDNDFFDIPRFPVEMHTTMPYLDAVASLPQIFA